MKFHQFGLSLCSLRSQWLPICILIKSDLWEVSCPLLRESVKYTTSSFIFSFPTWDKMISWTQCADLVLTNTLRLNSWYKSKFICPLGFSYMEIILSILLDGWALPQQVLQFCHFWAGSYHSAVKQLSHMSFCVWFHGSQMGCLLIWTLNRMEWSSWWQRWLTRASQ
jgi:hypothetical protein